MATLGNIFQSPLHRFRVFFFHSVENSDKMIADFFVGYRVVCDFINPLFVVIEIEIEIKIEIKIKTKIKVRTEIKIEIEIETKIKVRTEIKIETKIKISIKISKNCRYMARRQINTIKIKFVPIYQCLNRRNLSYQYN